MKKVTSIDIVIPTYRTEKLVINALKTFMKFNEGFDFNYYIVENSKEDYGKSIKKEFRDVDKIKWISNYTGRSGSEALSDSMEKGLEYCKSEYVFYCHADVIACKPDWMLQLFNKIVKDGYSLASFHGHWGYSSWHPDRVDACHSGGILTTTELARKVSMQPIYKDGIILWDSCAQLTKYCIENDLKYFWFNNSILPTHHYEKVPGNKPFDKLVRVTKCFDDDDKVIYLHLGRGVPRSIGQYTKVKDGIVTTQGWFDFTKKYILDA